ncbi:MAG: SDR family oxidoreductase, partial [Actinomycetota bacterium]|nr:SDR family oxidoreductase [Actinomycetota bacterium]
MGALDAKVAIVTGAARGIGRACAERFAAEGAAVVLADLDAPGGEVAAAGVGASFVRCDVSLRADVERLVEAAVGRYGALDLVVNAAGMNHRATLLETTEEDWDRVIDVDLKGTFLVGQAAARWMVAA